MRNQIIFSISFLFFFFLSLNSFSQEKRALIVAIGNYKPESKIPAIASLNDIKYLKAALHKNNFKDQYIDTLVDEQATMLGITKALDALIAKSKLNDIVVVHFSCHGQQIRDQISKALGKDEDDGFDEALLAYDALAFYKPGKYKGENHLRDDDLGKKLTAIRNNIGAKGSLLVVLDACHSGTGTRDESFAVSRGEPIPFYDPENPFEGEINLGGMDVNLGFIDGLDTSIANMVTFSASSPHQVNKQIKAGTEEVGSLSYALYKAMTETPAGSTYQFLFDKIRLFIQGNIPDQIPMMEGNGQQIIFSGAYAGSSSATYATVITPSPGEKSSKIISIDRGQLDNMAEGIACKIYKAGEKELYTKAVIKKVESFRSLLEVEKEMDNTTLYEVVADETNYGSIKPTIKIVTEGTIQQTKAAKRQIENYFTQFNTADFSDVADFQLLIKSSSGKDEVNLTDRNNKLIWTTNFEKRDTLNAQEIDKLKKSIRQEARIKYLRTLPDGGSLSQLVKVSVVKEGGEEAATGLEFVYGEKYKLKIENNSDEDLYYTVLDIYPDNTVEILYPYKTKSPADYFVKNNSIINRLLAVSQGSPKGIETLKIIITKQPMDLRAVFENRITRDDMHGFQAVMDEAMNDRTANATRGDVTNVKVEDVGVLSTSFIIK